MRVVIVLDFPLSLDSQKAEFDLFNHSLAEAGSGFDSGNVIFVEVSDYDSVRCWKRAGSHGPHCISDKQDGSSGSKLSLQHSLDSAEPFDWSLSV
ncbi:hypothetical protein Q011_00985 [Pseudomonas aeruginosa 6077]|nr:hypothetical protein Q062_01763 [Pseudomonas aeruginosa BL08]ERX46080.1 hypothetical protein Q011_00985 [Pseudomonas aeruginosa 6077]KZM04002.1 hypothetical protein AN929_23330 [Pseudomonas aeruginosa]CDM50849.1 hypothetical protein PAWS394_1899 [Pseudomonas aeruginosa WS394]KZM10349.1 hypothetical protein AN928_22730 [Pseudomonas aeruginosa]